MLPTLLSRKNLQPRIALMINVILEGCLGNNLFQYAAGKHLAVKNKTTIRLITYRHVNRHDILGRKAINQLSAFTIEPLSYAVMIHQAIGKRLGIQRSFHENRVYKEKSWGFHPEALELKDGVYLDGYFQSEKYFKSIEHIIRNNLRFKWDAFGKEGAIYKDQISNLNSVGLHVRRGDYLKLKLHNVCNIRYYIKSIAYMQDQLVSPHFFIFSDDLEWCHENLHISNCTFVDIQAAKKDPIIDFQLMSLCKHNIISNSTFSWWAAWLNNNHEKVVVSPNRWFNDEQMNVQALQDTIPAEWVRMGF
jgi:hypothetical protein